MMITNLSKIHGILAYLLSVTEFILIHGIGNEYHLLHCCLRINYGMNCYERVLLSFCLVHNNLG